MRSCASKTKLPNCPVRESQKIICHFGFGATILAEGLDRPPPFRMVNPLVQGFRAGQCPNPRTVAQQNQASIVFTPISDNFHFPPVPPPIEERRRDRIIPILYRREASEGNFNDAVYEPTKPRKGRKANKIKCQKKAQQDNVISD